MKDCIHCQTPMEDDALVCPACGKAAEEEIAEEYTRLSEAYGMELDKIKAAVEADAVAEDLKVKKAIDLVREKAVITEVEPAADAE